MNMLSKPLVLLFLALVSLKVVAKSDEANQSLLNPVDCLPLSQIPTDRNAVDLFIGLGECLSEENYHNGVQLYFAAMSFGFFDTKRVADRSAHQALSVIRMGILGSHSRDALDSLQQEVSKILDNNGEFCQQLRQLGPPNYHPDYMIQHGIKAFTGSDNENGLVYKFDAEYAWEEALVTIVKCESDKPIVVIPLHTYFFKDNQVWFKARRKDKLLENAEQKTFKTLSKGWGSDAKSVYFYGDLLVGADPSTFEVIDASNGKDARHVYRSGKKCDVCDAASFEALPFDWYKDKNRAYKRTSILKDSDPDSFVPLNDWFAKDKNYVYSGSFKIIGADATSFKLKKCGMSQVSAEDKNKCYTRGDGHPCDCDHKYDFPFVKQPLPENKSHINQVFRSKYMVDKVGDFEVVARMNAEVPFGKHKIIYSCQPDKDREPKMFSIDYNLEPLRRYSIVDRENALSECDSELLPLTWFEGQNDRIQVSVKYSEPGGTTNRDVWSVSTEMPEDLDSITLVCRYISKTELIHSEEELSFKPEKRHLYKGFGELSRDGKQCKARIFDETLGKVISE